MGPDGLRPFHVEQPPVPLHRPEAYQERGRRAPRTPAEFYEDWERICHPLPQGWPRLPTATNAIGYLYELAVDPPWQGHGLGGRLLDAVLQALTGLGTELIALRSSERASVAVGLYEQRGFTRWPLRERRQPDARWWQRRTTSPARD